MQAERAQHHGGIAAGLELLALGLQAAPEVDVIVDFAIEGDDVPGDGVEHRLHAGRRQIENREPAMRQQRAPAAIVRRRGPDTGGVRPAMDHGVVHPFQRRAVGLVQSSDNTGNAAHQISPLGDTLSHDLRGPSHSVRDWLTYCLA